MKINILNVFMHIYMSYLEKKDYFITSDDTKSLRY